MAALQTDLCADCGHRRSMHISGPLHPIACGAQGCPCPAFDEGAPKPLTSRTRFIDADLLKPLGATLARILAGPRNQERALADQLMRMFDVAVVQSDRLQAAELAVVEASLKLRDALRADTLRGGFGDEWTDAVERLRYLRARSREDECGAACEVDSATLTRCLIDVVGTGVTEMTDYVGLAKRSPVSCTLPRGHEGEHEGELGRWRWSS